MPKEHLLDGDLEYILNETSDLWENLRGQRLFITGGTGFVGTWLVESFVWANERLNLGAEAVLLSRNPDAYRAKAPYSGTHGSISFVTGDALSFEPPSGEFSFVIHGATEAHASATPTEPLGTFKKDIVATEKLLDFAASHRTTRFLFTSSGAIYGKQPADIANISEDYLGGPLTVDTRSVYGQAKRASELMCTLYAEQCDFTAVIARLFAFSGPHLPLDLNFAIGNFVRDVLAGGPVRIGGDGTPLRSYLYAADMTIWLWTLLIRGRSSWPYNVGSPDAVSIADLAKAVVNNTAPGTVTEIAGKPVPGSKPLQYVPAVDRVKEEFGLSPVISLEEGIRRMYSWNREMSGTR